MNNEQHGPASLDSIPFFTTPDNGAAGSEKPAKRRSRVGAVPTSAAQHLAGSLDTKRQANTVAGGSLPEHEPETPSIEELESSYFGITPDEKSYWEAINEIYEEASANHSRALEEHAGLTDEEIEEIARTHFQQAIRNYITRQVTLSGTEARWDDQVKQRAEKDLFNRMFRLGRFEDFIQDPTIENVHVNGHENVFVKRSDGTTEQMPPFAGSDEEMIDEISKILQRKGEGARAFDQANPVVHADLNESVRLVGTLPPLALRPTLVLRIHRLLDVTLDDMVRYGNLTAAMAHFLKVAVKAERSVIVSGYGGVGKTTLLRALADQIDPDEQIVTIETERELHLHKLSSRRLPPIAHEYRPAGESGAGEFSLEKAMETALRENARRVFVGEVRGNEVMAMIRAIQSGAGAFTTVHAEAPEEGIDVLTGLASRELSETYVARQLGRLVHFVVQLDMVEIEGRMQRRMVEISQVTPGEGDRGIALSPIFKLDVDAGDTDAKFIGLPSDERLLKRMRRYGLDTDRLQAGGF